MNVMLTRLIKSGKRWLIDSFYTPKKSKKLLLSVILVGITVIVLGVNVYKQRETLLTYNWQFRPLPFVLAFIIFSLTLFMGSIVWGYVLNVISKKLSYQKHIYFYIISNLAKRIPGTVWYVASRAQMYSEEGIALRVTTLASGLEMAFITLAGVITVLLFSTEIIVRYHLNPIIFAIILPVGFIILQPKFIKWFLKILKIEEINIDYKLVLFGLLSYIIIWILGGVLLYEIGSIVYPIPHDQIGYVIGSWTFIGVISILLLFSPSNFGITELGLSLLLSSIVPFSIAVVIAIASRILIIIFEFFWAGLFLLNNQLRKSH
jgi:hypothetical protein